MAREIFIDAGAWVALSDRSDTYHNAAQAVYPRVLRRWPYWVTTNLVCAEAYALIRTRGGGHAPAMAFLDRVRSQERLVRIYADADWEDRAMVILRRYADQDFSYADAVSFAVMQARNISHAFTFDKHFATAGFALMPAPPL
jgi:predicted nucleic acid-binding protein